MIGNNTGIVGTNINAGEGAGKDTQSKDAKYAIPLVTLAVPVFLIVLALLAWQDCVVVLNR
ncbi:hypothetical protein CC79DRAFT_1328095 [Sarocladium strictum]